MTIDYKTKPYLGLVRGYFNFAGSRAGIVRQYPQTAHTELHPESLDAVAYRIELLRVALGFKTKAAFGETIGISSQRLNSYLTGTPVPWPIMQRLMQLWRVDYRYIYHGDTSQLPHALAMNLERAKLALPVRGPLGLL
jgi:hypothetical protein